MVEPLVTSKGENTGCKYTFLNIIKSYVDQFNANNVFIAWDRKLLKEVNFRTTLTDGTYKGNRDQEKSKEVYSEVDGIIKLTESLGIKNIFPGKLEADDVISWLSKTIPGKKIIISVDNDFAQLVAPDISHFSPNKNVIVDIVNFENIHGVTPKEFLYYKAILGDVADNIPGVEGFGKVKGKKLAKSYNLYKTTGQVDELVKEHEHLITENLKLMDLSYGLDQFKEEIGLYSMQLAELDKKMPNFSSFKQICADLEFNSILSDIDNWQAAFNKKANNNLLTEYFKSFE